MDDFVDHLMLRPSEYRCRDVPEPRIQHEALLLKAKALDPTLSLPQGVDTAAALAPMDRPRPEKEAVRDGLNSLLDAFPLQLDPMNKRVHFQNRQLGQLPGKPELSAPADDAKKDEKF